MALGYVAEGIELMREAARIESDVAEHHANLAAALRHDGKTAEAAAAIDAGLVAMPGDTKLEMARVMLAMSKTKEEL